MTGRDFTSGNEIKQIISFGIPVMLGIVLMQLNNYIDSMVVGRYIGKEALAAVGASAPFIFMLVSVVIGVSIGSTVVIAQRYGRRDFEGVRTAADTLYIFLFISGLILTIVGLNVSGYVLALLGLAPDVLQYAKQYLDIYLLGLLSLFIFNSLSAVLRGVGDSYTPLIFLGLSSTLNIVLDIIFVVVFDLGIPGVAWASVVAQWVAVIFAVLYTNRKNKIVAVNFFKLKFSRSSFVQQMKLGLPAGIQQLFHSIGILTIFSIITGFGTDVVAAYSAAYRIETLIYALPMAMSIALTNFVGQNYGAGRFDRIDNGVKGIIKMSFVISFVVLLLLSAFARPLMMLFFDDENIIIIGCNYLLVLAIGYPIYNAMFILMGAMRGVGNTVMPMIITTLMLWLIRIPAAEILSRSFGELGIWIASPMAWSVGLACAVMAYLRLRLKIGREQPLSPAPSTSEV